MALSDIPYFIGPVANSIIHGRAKRLRRTADESMFRSRSAISPSNTKTMSRFYNALMDEGNAPWKSSALPLKAAAKNGAGPKDCSLSIALSGGGLRVVAFLSFLETLKEHQIPISAYAGTSAGALATMFDRIGVDYKTVWECLDASLLRSLILAPSASLLKGIALLSGKRLTRFFNDVLPDGMKTYRELPRLYTTSVLVNSWGKWEQGVNEKGKDATRGIPETFKRYRKVIFSRDFDPDMPIAKGVFSSMSLPVFKSLAFRGREFKFMENGEALNALSTQDGRTIDGGYAVNYPLNVLLLPCEANKDPNTHMVINVAVDDPNGTRVRKQNVARDLLEQAPDVSSAGEMDRDRFMYANSNIIWWTIGGKARGVGLFDFDKIDDMREAGRESAEALLRTVGIMR